MNILGIIPARGGSKSIPRKNIIPLAGKPLLAYTCLAAIKSRKLTRVILNTDDEEISDIGKEFGVDSPFLRPKHLADDETPILPVINHTLKWLETEDDFYADFVVLLQPTSPLRTAEHIDAALDLILGSDADSLVSVQEVPHQFNPVSVMMLNEAGYLQPYHTGEMILRRQDKPRLYARNGPAILVTVRRVLEAGLLYGEKVLPYKMDYLDSLDVDDLHDLTLLEALLNYRGF